MPTASSLAWKTSLRKVGTLALQQIKGVALYLYDWSWWYPSGNATVAAISGPLPGAGYGQFDIRLTAWLQNSKKRAERSEIDVWAEFYRDYLRSEIICIIVCLSWAVNHYRDNAIAYKASAFPAEELKLANAAITDMQMRQRDVAALDAKYTKELADAKAENDALRDDVAAGRRRLRIKSDLSIGAWSRLTAAWICSLPDWQTPLNGIISPSERGWSLCKSNWKEPKKYINEQCR